jgi:hypothetical protein
LTVSFLEVYNLFDLDEMVAIIKEYILRLGALRSTLFQFRKLRYLTSSEKGI